MVAFIPSLQMTSVANVAVIIATQPFIAAGLAFLWFREAARWRTLLASLVAFIGVVITVSQSVTSCRPARNRARLLHGVFVLAR